MDPLAGLPRPGARRLAVRLSPAGLAALRSGHPWVFDRSVSDVRPEGAPGDLAVVFDDRRRFAGIGLWDPTSPIRVRALHAGEPTTIDEGFWAGRLATALARRGALVADTRTTGYRVVHGESDGFGGLVVDRYGEVLVVKVYTPAWLPHLRELVPLLVASTAAEGVVVRLSRHVAAGATHGLGDGAVVAGTVPEGSIPFLELGLRFQADVRRGQKTGHFLDQRDNRALVGSMSSGVEVLDVFACTGGFSVHAAAGGATSVLSVDRSPHAMEAARAHVAANRDRPSVAACDHATEVGDAFEVLERLGRSGRRFDLVVIDPPSFAARASAVSGALPAYARLTSLGLAVTRPGGTFVQSSCSSRIDVETFHRTIARAAEGAGADLVELHRTEHPIDHPATFPEARYLKTLIARVERR